MNARLLLQRTPLKSNGTSTSSWFCCERSSALSWGDVAWSALRSTARSTVSPAGASQRETTQMANTAIARGRMFDGPMALVPFRLVSVVSTAVLSDTFFVERLWPGYNPLLD